jgi:signal peptidase I
VSLSGETITPAAEPGDPVAPHAIDAPPEDVPAQPQGFARERTADSAREHRSQIRLAQLGDELLAWVKTLLSAAVYATLIVTFGFQVARVEGRSMAPTLEDQDRLIVNKLAYRLGEPNRGDIVMLYYPPDPTKSFVKRVIAQENDTVRIVNGHVYVNDTSIPDDYVPEEYRSHDNWGPQAI